jgi:hypothetical protein
MYTVKTIRSFIIIDFSHALLVLQHIGRMERVPLITAEKQNHCPSTVEDLRQSITLDSHDSRMHRYQSWD